MVLLLLACFIIVTPIAGVCNSYMFCCTLLYVYSSFVIILMGKGELAALLRLTFLVSADCFVLPRGALGLSAVCNCGIS